MSYDYDPTLDLYLTVDPGYTNPFAGLWIQPIEKAERFLVVREYYQTLRTSPENARAMLQIQQDCGYSLTGACGDPANPERLVLLSEVLGVTFEGPRLPVVTGQEYVRRYMKVRPEDGRPGLLIHHRCKNLIHEATIYLEHKPGVGENHALDALRYFFCYWFGKRLKRVK
jgi:hypothetical protein